MMSDKLLYYVVIVYIICLGLMVSLGVYSFIENLIFKKKVINKDEVPIPISKKNIKY